MTIQGMLPTGYRLRTERGDTVTVEGLFGSGGQGEVYKVRTSSGSHALKWYFPHMATEAQLDILRGLVDQGLKDERFLWPRQLVADPTRPGEGFGYLMDVRPPNFHDLPELFRREVRTNYRALVTAALNCVEAFQLLHADGIVYRDISWGNLFFDPTTGAILICDNDNATFDGQEAGVNGTPNFMAPEVVRQDPGVRLSERTDLHSLAVLIFYLLMNHHPLEGAAALKIRCMDDKAMKLLHGTRPLFIFDPTDNSNHPVPGEQDVVLATWAALPPVLRDLFGTTFGPGLADPSRRVRLSTWRDTLSRVRDSIVLCTACGKQNLTEPFGPAPACWSCGRSTGLPDRLEVTVNMGPGSDRSVIYLQPGSQIFEHHLEVHPTRHDFSKPVADVTEHPKHPGRLGLTNRTTRPWTIVAKDGARQQVAPGRTAAIHQGVEIELCDGAVGLISAGDATGA